jgi:hypothetical protein
MTLETTLLYGAILATLAPFFALAGWLMREPLDRWLWLNVPWYRRRAQLKRLREAL